MSNPTPPNQADVSEATYQRLILMFGATVCLVLLAIVGVLCYRVALDGNSGETASITNQLAGVVPWLAGALVAAVVGVKGIATWIQGKLP